MNESSDRSENAVARITHPIKTAKMPDGAWKATETGTDIEGRGPNKHEAIVNYVRDCHESIKMEEGQEVQASD